MNTHKREAACLVPHEFSSRPRIIKRGTRNDAFAGARVASAGGVVFGVRWLDAAFDFASALAFQTVAVAGTERKKPNQSGVEPPHSKEGTSRWATGKPIQAIRAVSDALRKSSEETLADARTHGIQCGKQKRRDISLFSIHGWEEAAANRTSEERDDR